MKDECRCIARVHLCAEILAGQGQHSSQHERSMGERVEGFA